MTESALQANLVTAEGFTMSLANSRAEESGSMKCPRDFRLNTNQKLLCINFFFFPLPMTFSPEGSWFFSISFGSLEHLVGMRPPLGLIYDEYDTQQ